MYINKFIDNIKIYCKSGDGGKGLIHFKKRKKIIPDGGNGGKGGNVLLVGNNNFQTLMHLKNKKYYYASNGSNGGINCITGSSGNNIRIQVPIGTIVKNENGKIIFEINNNREEKILFLGGKGGLGNFIKNNKDKNYQIGSKGYKGWIFLELKILSDIGLVGFPNSGKSTLLSILTSAHPKISNYPFTTITPNLGIMYYNNISLSIADIPGIIKNASKGKGLGYKFLKHIEKNTILLFIISAEMKNPKKMYKKLIYELYKFNPILLQKKRLLIISKIDLLDILSRKKLIKKLSGCNPYILLSSLNKIGIDIIKDKIYKMFIN